MKLYEALKKFIQGTADEWDVRRSDDNTRIGRVNQNSLGKSLVTLTFYEEEFAKIFLGDNSESDNNTYYFNVAFNRRGYYGGSVFVDAHYFGDDEWKYGACWWYFNEDNRNLFLSILKILNPGLVELDDNGKPDDEAFQFLLSKYTDEIEQINYEYAELYDESLVVGLREYILKKTCDVFSEFGIYEKDCARQYLTTVSVLMSLWKMTGTDEDSNVLDLLHNLAIQRNLIIDEDLYEDYYSYFDEKNFDSESFNRTVERQLEKIKDKIDEEIDEGTLQDSIKIHNQLSKLGYKFGRWYSLPDQKHFNKIGKKNEKFNLLNVIGGKIVFNRLNPDNGIAQSAMGPEDFFNYLYHPELFESKK